MDQIEWIAATEAAEAAKRSEREFWLPRLEIWLLKWELEHPKGTMLGDLYGGRLREEIKRLRRALGIYKGSEEQRAAVRERVRKSRERERAEWNNPRSIHWKPPSQQAAEIRQRQGGDHQHEEHPGQGVVGDRLLHGAGPG